MVRARASAGRADVASEFRFYEELNDFLAPALRKRSFSHQFSGTPAVKDRIEALGVPHTEVELILVDGESVDFTHRLRGGERVAVYPMFERFDLGGLRRLRLRPLRQPRFVLDVHLGRLAAYLRLLGFDCLYRQEWDDPLIIETARHQKRIVLSRDRGLLKDGRVSHGAYLHQHLPLLQLQEVIQRFQLEHALAPYTRCLRCNHGLQTMSAGEIEERVPATARRPGLRYTRCPACNRAYWPGSHIARLRQRFASIGITLP